MGDPATQGLLQVCMSMLQRGLTLGFIVRTSVRWSWALGSVSNHSASPIAPPRDETKEEALAPVFAGARSSRRALFRGMRLAGWRQGSVAREGGKAFRDRRTDRRTNKGAVDSVANTNRE